jgi:nicotinamidase-related amidase
MTSVAGGTTTEYVRVGDQGAKFIFRFCPVCGSTVLHSEDRRNDSVSVAVGAFADPNFPPPRVSVYDSRRHPWVLVPPGVKPSVRIPLDYELWPNGQEERVWSYCCGTRFIHPEETTMATVREGNKSVLLIVDVQVSVMRDAWDAPRIIEKVSRAVERARAQNVPVIWVQHSDGELAYGSPEWEWVPELVPAEGEPLIHKQFNSSFEQTELDQELARLGATHIALAGAATNWCIRATAYGALDRGYDLTLVEDAHTTGTIDRSNGTSIEAATIIDELNIAMTWLTYPGRSNGIARVDELNYSTPAGSCR